jgi:hypothetical protein
MTPSRYHCALLLVSFVAVVQGLSNGPLAATKNQKLFSRRAALVTTAQVMIGGALTAPLPAFAAPDCLQDCMKECKKVAPKDPEYCLSNCNDYCAQEDRADGLSGSVSAASGEVGILGGTFGQGTVPKGEDKVSDFRSK